MEPIDVIVLVLAAGFVVVVLGKKLMDAIKGKSDCGCGGCNGNCANCPSVFKKTEEPEKDERENG